MTLSSRLFLIDALKKHICWSTEHLSLQFLFASVMSGKFLLFCFISFFGRRCRLESCAVSQWTSERNATNIKTNNTIEKITKLLGRQNGDMWRHHLRWLMRKVDEEGKRSQNCTFHHLFVMELVVEWPLRRIVYNDWEWKGFSQTHNTSLCVNQIDTKEFSSL